jgi:cytochrome b561
MQRYPGTLIALHWIITVAVIVAYITSGNPTKPKDALDFLMGQTHVMAGMTVFALTLVRLPVRALFGTPQSLPAPRWQQRAASAAHIALYVLMLVVPLAGWSALADKTPSFTLAGGFMLPLPDARATWVKLLGETHEVIGNVFIWVAGLHAVAGLAHHYLLRDTTLTRMLPLKVLGR